MLFKYKAVDDKGANKEGEIDAPNRDMAISGLQRRGLIIVSIQESAGNKNVLHMAIFEKVPKKDVVILSRQISTLFEAQVSALKAFTMLSTNVENPLLGRKLTQVCDDLQAGVSISGAAGSVRRINEVSHRPPNTAEMIRQGRHADWGRIIFVTNWSFGFYD